MSRCFTSVLWSKAAFEFNGKSFFLHHSLDSSSQKAPIVSYCRLSFVENTLLIPMKTIRPSPTFDK